MDSQDGWSGSGVKLTDFKCPRCLGNSHVGGIDEHNAEHHMHVSRAPRINNKPAHEEETLIRNGG